MVDDGSTDDSLDLCRELSDERNVKILHRENGGAGRARNAGIAEARGKYVYCLDVDDSLEDGSLSILLGQCFDQNLDAVFFGALVEYASEEVKTSDPQDDRYFERAPKPARPHGRGAARRAAADPQFLRPAVHAYSEAAAPRR